MGFLGLLEHKLLKESASVENVVRAMDNHHKVIINYQTDGGNEHTGSRIIEPVTYGLTKAGNPVVRAYQPFGDTTTNVPSWKFFRLDRITYWEETSADFGKIPDYNIDELNKYGDKTMSVVIKNYLSTEKNSGDDSMNAGPKTKEKIHKTSGDTSLDVGKRNLELLRNPIKIDLDDKKGKSGYRIYTDKTPNTTGPRNASSDTQYDTYKNKPLYKTSGDTSLDVGKRNLELLRNPNKIDLDDRRDKSENDLRVDKNITSSPRFPNETPQETMAKVHDNDDKNINPEELDQYRDEVYKTSGDTSLDVGKRNLELLRNPIKIDLERFKHKK